MQGVGVHVSVSTQVRWPDHGEAPRSNSHLGTCGLREALDTSVIPPSLGSEPLWERDRPYCPYSSLLPTFPELWLEVEGTFPHLGKCGAS